MGALTDAAGFVARGTAVGADARAYREGAPGPGSGGTAADACFRLRSSPSGPRRLRMKDGGRLLWRSLGCATAQKEDTGRS